MAKESSCIDCGSKVLSRTRPKKRCPTCEDVHRTLLSNLNKAIRRKKLKEQLKMFKLGTAVLVGQNNTDVRDDGISKATNYTDDIDEKQGLQKASN